MASVSFTSGTVIPSIWLNDVNSIVYTILGNGTTAPTTKATARINLGLAIGTDVQAYSATLSSWASKTVPTGTVIGDSDTQILSNKTIGNTNTVTVKDSLFTVQDDGDVTKQFTIQLSGLTTGNIRTWTIGNYSGIPAVPANEGTSGYLLQSSGAGAQPIWVAASGGGGTSPLLFTQMI